MYYLILPSATNKETESQRENSNLLIIIQVGSKWQSRNSNLGLSDSKVHIILQNIPHSVKLSEFHFAVSSCSFFCLNASFL